MTKWVQVNLAEIYRGLTAPELVDVWKKQDKNNYYDIRIEHKPTARIHKPYQVYLTHTSFVYHGFPKILASFSTRTEALKFVKRYIKTH